MNTDYDPSLPAGMIYRADTKVDGSYTVKASFKYLGSETNPKEGDDANWKMFQPGYGYMGIVFGAQCLQESYGKNRNAFQFVVHGDGKLRCHLPWKKQSVREAGFIHLDVGDSVDLTVSVTPNGDGKTQSVMMLCRKTDKAGEIESTSKTLTHLPMKHADSWVGIAGRGLMDFQVDTFQIQCEEAKQYAAPEFECYACYPLGDTLAKDREGNWNVRFVGLFHSDGERAEVRVADRPDPEGGWDKVPVAGAAKIVSNDWRRNTASILAKLPVSPAEKTLYYTVWKDGQDVTADTRIGSPAVGPGTGLVGDVPTSGSYVGRLPQLKAPYKLCGLSCHAITSGLQVKTDSGYKMLGGAAEWQFRDQPTEGAYKHLEDFHFQIMVWEDDVWYMELVMYPPSTDDAYKIVKHSICGPTSRWQLMRHWNVINPGDHDYGMDDIKGPEQLIIRKVDGLGQDASYIRRNFQIVHHLITGDEKVDPLVNPKKWRAWKMPNRDFTFVILDSRLWRSSQDTDIWDDSGWDKFKSLYDRTDPTRSLLGEEQFSWLQDLVTTDSSRLICLTGINGMHTIWTGGKGNFESGKHPQGFNQRDRVTADYAGWVKAGADRVLELLGSRDGIVTVYGDVHNGCIMKNVKHGVIECSFGPIGRSGGRGVIPGFGPKMKDVDGREVEIHSLYHKTYADAELNEHAAGDPYYWNFLEMEFDPTQSDPKIGLRVRNMIDSPKDNPRGGGALETSASETGEQRITVTGANLKTLPNAEVRFLTLDGKPIRATQSDADGKVPNVGVNAVSPGDKIMMLAVAGKETESKLIDTYRDR